MSKNTHCPNCWIGLSTEERNIRYCQNCSHSWNLEDNEEFSSSDSDKKYINNAIYIASIL